ncbi:hypothetical protein EJB05_03021 [Eragrostis curvula]|uniref:DRBM domain-containing protein n=1 Tax=Eragrostis curvula TaxID=38414 RepID=A0A5J9WXS5_9POAL|nr:hypothetical protein EJB05_03021 [Eragrostis curvula]
MDGGGAAPTDAASNPSPAPGVVVGRGGIRVENCYVFKSRLQEYAQKAGLSTPEYHTLKEGPSHEPIFKSTVVVNNTKYESLPGFFSRKAAEQSAAEVALMEIARSVPATEGIRAVQETGLCKNLLQEYAQKMNYAIPSYICTKQASGVAPFICTVEIGGIQYIGAAARTKKEAEIKAARTALLAIQGQSEGGTNGATQYIVVPGQRQVKEAEKRPIETPKPLKAKKDGYKKKWNKRKFMRKTDQTGDAEMDGVRMAGDGHDSDVPIQAIIPEEPPTNTAMARPDDEVRRVEHELLMDTTMMQHSGEATIAKQEPPSGLAALLHDEVRRVELETFRGTAMAHNNEEQELPFDTAMQQPGEEARLVESVPPRDTSMLQPNDASILQPCNLVCSAELLNLDKEARSIGQESLSFSATMQPNGEATNVKKGPPGNTATMQPEDRMKTIEQVVPSNAECVQPLENHS